MANVSCKVTFDLFIAMTYCFYSVHLFSIWAQFKPVSNYELSKMFWFISNLAINIYICNSVDGLLTSGRSKPTSIKDPGKGLSNEAFL